MKLSIRMKLLGGFGIVLALLILSVLSVLVLHIGAVIDADAGRVGIINTHALDTIPDNIAAVAPIRYDSEDTAGRVERREKRWTPVATVPW